MSHSRRVLITGSSGLIGARMAEAFAHGGWEVWGLDLIGSGPGRTLPVNLLEAEATRAAVKELPAFEALVHLAGLVPEQPPRPPATFVSVNTTITENLVAALGQRQPHFIFLSSVAVYGEDRRFGPVAVGDGVRPATNYGLSKLRCEEMLLRSSLPHVDILRVAAVFDENHLARARKRVFAPGLPIRLKLIPPARYSLCHLTSVVRKTLILAERGPFGRHVHNVADDRPYDQHELLAWFQGPVLPLPVALTRPIYWLLRLTPGNKAYHWRCLYWKMFRSDLYALD
jgi:nucleoside-diphosphate-sugar epimerase